MSRERSTAEFPMMTFLSTNFSASAAGRAFILTEPATKCLLLKQKVQRLTFLICLKNELGEGGEVDEIDEGPLQHCRQLTT
jgi:hypothetical protein